MAHDTLRERLRASGGGRSAAGERQAPDGRNRPADDGPTHDALIDAVAEEIGGTVEAAMRVAIDRAQDVALSLLGSRGNPRRVQHWLGLSSAADERLSRLPQTSGRAAKASSRWAMQSGMRLLRKAHRTLNAQQP